MPDERGAMKKVIVCFSVLFVFLDHAISSENEFGTEGSCAIRVKAAVYPSDSSEQYGKARVYATLMTKDGMPITNQEIQLAANCGEFSCKPSDAEDPTVVDSAIASCTQTDKNGKIMVYLVNIPFNVTGHIDAACDYGNMSVKASCTFLISRSHIARKPLKKKAAK